MRPSATALLGWLPFLVLGPVLIRATPASADEPLASLEYPVKASLLLNFARFTEWPPGSPQASSPTVSICVLGTDPFGSVLDATVERRSLRGRAVVVERYGSLDGIEGCHVLFIASSERDRLPEVLATVAESPVLTVSESDGFEDRGGMVHLLVADNYARFSVNLVPARQTRLRLSSKLLSVARSVHGAAR